MSRIETQRRQQLLAHLNTHGRSNVAQISAALQVDRSTVRTYLKALLADRAVRQSTQIDGTAATPYYTALVQASSVEPAAHAGRIINLGSERRRPLPSPGGQGALRRAFGIQSGMA